MFTLSRYLITQEMPNDATKTLFYSTRTGEIVLMSTSVIDKVKEKRWSDLSFSELKQLTRCEMIVTEDENELASVQLFRTYSESVKETLGITIQPTANCQLGCHYCGQEHSNIKMSDDIVQKTIKRIKETLISEKYQHLAVTWYGGEPLMAIDLIEKFHEDIYQFCIDNQVGYKSDMALCRI